MDSTPGATGALVGGACGGVGAPGCCAGVVAGAALWRCCLAWEGGTPLSCLPSLLADEEECEGAAQE